jgi:CDP-paratose 2-epimerase
MKSVVITGGAGFIGANLTDRLAQAGERVVIYDNLARPGVVRNVDWLRRRHGDRVRVEEADVRDFERVRRALDGARAVFHFAAQVAVTSSLDDPREDFSINAGGTLNVLEAVRGQAQPPPLVFTSTNKVYGALDDLALEVLSDRWTPSVRELALRGISERRPLEFHSPYGCSKGAADQYVLDYARSYGLPATVFRMSCIYGPRQFGTEDQGWVAHFFRRAAAGQPITIYGDGCQVRDLLFIEDLVEAFLRARAAIDRLRGRAFNLGGGVENSLSLRELMARMERMDGRAPQVRHDGWRTGDQRWYVSDTRTFRELTGWQPRVRISDGLVRLREWIGQLEGETGMEEAAAT